MSDAERRIIEAAVDYYNMPCTITDYNLFNAVQSYLAIRPMTSPG